MLYFFARLSNDRNVMDIQLGKNDKRYIEGTDDVFGVMSKILQRENKIDQEKEHFWIIGMNEAGFILYIELIALGTVRSVPIEPMNVFRVAVMKNATRVIAIHNHPSKRLVPSEQDKDITDRLIQVGRILNIQLIDHLIISTEDYQSFRALGLMDELENSLKYVPTYQAVEKVRKEEQEIAKNKVNSAKHAEKTARNQSKILVNTLLNKEMSIEEIANILSISMTEVKKIISSD